VTERQTDDIARYATERRKRGNVRKIALLVLLVLLLMLFAWSAAYYAENRRLPFRSPLGSVTQDEVLTPEYLYSISGPETEESLKQPLGVAIKGDQLFVVDGTARVVRCYDIDGGYNFSFAAIQSDKGTALELPARATIGPDGNVWVTDRRLPGIFVFDPDNGSFVREFTPASDIVNEWGPLALAFNEKGDLYVADVGQSDDHRIVAFDSAGNEIARWGETAQTTNPQQSPGKFFYPNGIAFDKDGNVYVSDMSNHRVQVFGPTGEFKAVIPSSGSPLGMVMDAENRLYVVDPFAHTVDIYSTEDGTRMTGFGQPGYGLGQFRFPNDVALDENNRIYVSDRENYQVQVWGWPSGLVPPVELPDKPLEWVVCLSPLLLLLIPLLRRRTAFMTTVDFLEEMISIEGAVPKMDDRRFKWIVTEAVYAAYERREVEGVNFGDLLDGQPYSRTDVEDFMEKSGADEATAIVITMAERVGRLATEDEALAEAAAALDIRVADAERFLEEYANGRRSATARRSE
jgi:DNA-binding beta-propeller fold protein YncE